MPLHEFSTMIETIHWHTLHPRYLGAGSTVLDLGANYGHFALAVTQRFGCHCVAIEPSPECFAAIPDSAKISKLQIGIAGAAGQMPFHIAAPSPTLRLPRSVASSFVFPVEQAQTIEIQVISLPELVKQLAWSRVDLIKIDIEGAEIEVLNACPDDFLRRIAQISVEFHDFCGITPLSDVRYTLRRLHSLGFSSVRMSRIGHQDTWLINRRLVDISTSELFYTRYIARNWMGFRRVMKRQFYALKNRRTKSDECLDQTQ
jgi:FkbM family methyltransferase